MRDLTLAFALSINYRPLPLRLASPLLWLHPQCSPLWRRGRACPYYATMEHLAKPVHSRGDGLSSPSPPRIACQHLKFAPMGFAPPGFSLHKITIIGIVFSTHTIDVL